MQKLKRTIYVFPGVLLALVLVLALFASLVAASDPILVDPFPQNPNCQSFGYDLGVKINLAPNGTYYFDTNLSPVTLVGWPSGVSDPNNWVKILNSDGLTFDWESSIGIDAVIVKGGSSGDGKDADKGYIYYYQSPDGENGWEATSDEGLHAIEGQGISHIEFCLDYELDVDKEAYAEYDTQYDWDIIKKVNSNDDGVTFDLFDGESHDAQFEIVATRKFLKYTNLHRFGTITVENNTPFDATITSLVDMLDGVDISGDLTCKVDGGVVNPINYVLADGDTMTCTYDLASADILDESYVFADGSNEVTVTSTGVQGGEASDTYSWVENDKIDEDATVTDSIEAGSYSDDNADGVISWVYYDNFACETDEGKTTNTATVTSNDTNTQHTDDAWVQLNCHTPTMSKTAVEDFTKTFNWTITKGGTPDHALFEGESGDINWEVVVTQTGFTNTNFVVSGEITFSNPLAGSRDLELSSIADLVDDYLGGTMAADVYDCNTEAAVSSLTVSAASATVCYDAVVASGVGEDGNGDPFGDSNIASADYTAYTFNYLGNETGSSLVGIDTGDETIVKNAPTLVNDEITVQDNYNNGGSWVDLGTISGSTTFDATSSPSVLATTESCNLNNFENEDDVDYSFDVVNDARLALDVGYQDAQQADVTFTCYRPTMSKTAVEDFTKTFNWTITKGGTPDHALFEGESGDINWEVVVTQTGFTNTNFVVSGEITFNNPLAGSRDLELSSIADLVDDYLGGTMAADVYDCNTEAAVSSLTVSAASATVCYDAVVASGVGEDGNGDPFGDSNIASANYNLYNENADLSLTGPSGTASIDTGDETIVKNAPTLVNDEITVQDNYNNGGSWVDLGTISGSTTFDATSSPSVLATTESCNLNNFENEDDVDYSFDVVNDARLALDVGYQDAQQADVTFTCYRPTMSKTAVEDFTKTFNWTITKGGTPDHALFEGESGDINWEVVVTQTGFTNTNFVVSGEITFNNPLAGSRDLELSSIADLVDDYLGGTMAADVYDCNTEAAVSSLTVSAASATVCYDAVVASGVGEDGNGDPFGDSNIASANYNLYNENADLSLTGPSGTASIDTGDETIVKNAPTLVNDEITVQDNYNNGGSWVDLGTISGSTTFDATSSPSVLATTESCNLNNFENEDDVDYSFDVVNDARLALDVGYQDAQQADVTFTCYRPTMSKTAVEDFTKTFNWTITKGGTPDHALFEGESGDINWEVVVTQTGFTNTNFVVSGEITFNNPLAGSRDLELSSIADLVDDYLGGTMAADVYDCNTEAAVSSLTVSAASATVCYDAVVASGVGEDGNGDPFGDSNIASANYNLYNENADLSLTGPSGTASIDTGDETIVKNAPTLVNDEITVQDNYNNGGSWVDLGTISGSTTFDATSSPSVLATTESCNLNNFENEDDVDYSFDVVNDARLALDVGYQDAQQADVTFTCYRLAMEKEADVEYTTYYDWNIDKEVFNDNGFLADGKIMLDNGQSAPYPTIVYSITVDVASTWQNTWVQSGSVTITNPHPGRDAEIKSLTDLLIDDADDSKDVYAAWFECGTDTPVTFPLYVTTSETVCYETAEIDSQDANPFVDPNVANAVQQLYDFGSDGLPLPDDAGTANYSASADLNVSEGDKVDECITVYDQHTITYNGVDTVMPQVELGTVCQDEAPHTFYPEVTFTPDMFECGDSTYRNDASFIENDTLRTGSDFVTIPVTKTCDDSCSLTPGYWKTHAPEPFLIAARSDSAWYLDDDGDLEDDDTGVMPVILYNGVDAIPGVDGPETIFPNNGGDVYSEGKGRWATTVDLTYYNVLHQPPQGNEWFILANHFAAAHLNIQNGATYTDIDPAFAEAYALLLSTNPNYIAGLKGNAENDVRADLVYYAGILADFNEGIIGPGHCDDPSFGS